LQTPVVAVPHQYYVGPAMISTQQLPQSADFVIASGFSLPPPPLLEYFVVPALFHTSNRRRYRAVWQRPDFPIRHRLPEYLLP